MTQVDPISAGTAAPRFSPFLAHAPAFRAVVGEDPRLALVTLCDAHEGPVYAPAEDALYFTSLPDRARARHGPPRVAIRRLQLAGERFPLERGRIATVRRDANGANGMTLDPDGSLLVCEQGSWTRPARIARLDPRAGRTEVVVDGWRGLPLNSPNDVVRRSDGTIWFTDPSYGHLQGFRPEPLVGDYVYRFDPATGRASVMADGFVKPNGIVFSPDERTLYVTDSGANLEPGSYDPRRPHHIVAFDVLDGRRLGPARLFAVVAPGFPDGLKVDAEGRVYASCSSGVLVFEPGGELIGEITVPGAVNFCFGGPRRNVLFITTDDAVWAAVLAASGPEPPSGAPLP